MAPHIRLPLFHHLAGRDANQLACATQLTANANGNLLCHPLLVSLKGGSCFPLSPTLPRGPSPPPRARPGVSNPPAGTPHCGPGSCIGRGGVARAQRGGGLGMGFVAHTPLFGSSSSVASIPIGFVSKFEGVQSLPPK